MSLRPSRQTRRPSFLDEYDFSVSDRDESVSQRGSIRHDRRVRRRVTKVTDRITFRPNIDMNINLDNNLNDSIIEINSIITNQRRREPEINNLMPEPTLEERAIELGRQRQSSSNYRNQISMSMYLNARVMGMDNFSEDNVPIHYGGRMDQVCIFCKSKFFNFERNSSGFYSLCCQRGKVKLTNFVPDLMQELFQGSIPVSKIFLKNCRMYNNQLSFASITTNEGKLPTIPINIYLCNFTMNFINLFQT